MMYVTQRSDGTILNYFPSLQPFAPISGAAGQRTFNRNFTESFTFPATLDW
jgi:hypothetical protein